MGLAGCVIFRIKYAVYSILIYETPYLLKKKKQKQNNNNSFLNVILLLFEKFYLRFISGAVLALFIYLKLATLCIWPKKIIIAK